MREVNQLEFIDTNVLIYAHDRSAGQKHVRAKQIVQELWETRTGCLSIQVLQEFYVNVTQKVAKPLNRNAAAQIIADLAAWEVHRPGAQDLLDAIRFQERYQLSFWDAMIIASSIELGCDILWSEDLNPGQFYDRVKVINPFV
jgi:predicted nucleic acid-binding protein